MGRVEFPDSEVMVTDFLKTRVEGDAAAFVPKVIPPRFIQIMRVGGAADNRAVETVSISWTAWGKSKADASAAAQKLRSVFLNDYSAMPLVRGLTEVTGPYFDPDPDTGRARYSGQVSLRVRGKRII
ncbi:hypothetical protein D9V32_13470 [Mycetocola tolaasinivorans]|uniref:DUF3168 domain-containing protein n=1 Tax=Mycetocola tolaasinivorans TaxID=76635 RepID=A0A3L7A4X9_9MICO|nr:hypothetical protein [Mycetocola tolaasinivorans]RLP74352.1 hypothetical protein D9V32_13470 [Mycetocola tolaasinivorans]